jgi:hypothetical protein
MKVAADFNPPVSSGKNGRRERHLIYIVYAALIPPT